MARNLGDQSHQGFFTSGVTALIATVPMVSAGRTNLVKTGGIFMLTPFCVTQVSALA